MGASTTYKNKLLRYLNRQGASPLEAIDEFIMYLRGKKAHVECEQVLYPEKYVPEETHYLKVVIEGKKYQFRSPAGANKKWILLIDP